MKIHAIKTQEGRIVIINGTRCSELYCREFGCDFPKCATFSGEEFDTIEEAVQKYPDLEVV